MLHRARKIFVTAIAVGLLLLLAVTVSAWRTSPTQRPHLSYFKRYPPEHFFTSPKQIALAKAIYDGDLSSVERLIPGTDLNKPGINGGTILLYALQEIMPVQDDGTSVRFRIISVLVRAGADPEPDRSDPTDLSKTGILDYAVRMKSPFVLRALLDGGLSPNYLRFREEPLIFSVATDTLMPSLKLLVQRHADVNQRDSLGNTALYRAIVGDEFDAINYLLDHGADPKSVNRAGISIAWNLKDEIDRAAPNSPAHSQLIKLRDRIISMGVKWPPDSPKIERQRMRARGEKPISPVDGSISPLDQ